MAKLDPELGAIIWLTLRVAGTALVASVLLGVPTGAWLGLARFRGKGMMTAILYSGMGLPPVVVGLVVYLLLSRSGPLGSLGWLFTPWAMVLAEVLIASPLIAGITMAAVAVVPRELLLQVQSLGAGPWQARWAMLREARPGVVVAVAAGLGRIISEVGAALMVGGNIAGHTRVLTTAIVLETSKGRFGLALSLAGWLLALTLVVNLGILRARGRPLP